MRALLDACVLYPTLTRGLLLEVAAAGLYVPLWSERIMGEWMRAAAKETPGPLVAAEAALMRARWSGAWVEVPETVVAGLSLPDSNDTHVLAAAIAGEASLLVTYNLKDFPGRTLARHGLRPVGPDTFLLELLDEAPDQVLAALDRAMAGLSAAGPDRRALLKRAQLPRLAKAVQALG